MKIQLNLTLYQENELNVSNTVQEREELRNWSQYFKEIPTFENERHNASP
jgi:hypothetical protein